MTSLINRVKDSGRRERAAVIGITAGILVFLIGGTGFGLTNVVGISPSTLKDQASAVTANSLRPQGCIDASVYAYTIKTGGEPLTGDNGGPAKDINGGDITAGDLLIADDNTAHIVGGALDDCIVGGAAAFIDGGGGANNVCIGDVAKMTNCNVQIPG